MERQKELLELARLEQLLGEKQRRYQQIEELFDLLFIYAPGYKLSVRTVQDIIYGHLGHPGTTDFWMKFNKIAKTKKILRKTVYNGSFYFNLKRNLEYVAVEYGAEL